jgi:hypothetical protein
VFGDGLNLILGLKDLVVRTARTYLLGNRLGIAITLSGRIRENPPGSAEATGRDHGRIVAGPLSVVK